MSHQEEKKKKKKTPKLWSTHQGVRDDDGAAAPTAQPLQRGVVLLYVRQPVAHERALVLPLRTVRQEVLVRLFSTHPNETEPARFDFCAEVLVL